MENIKGKYKLNVVGASGEGKIVDLVYEATSLEFVTWLRRHGRVYVPYYTGLNISPDERAKEIELVDRKGNITPELLGAGETLEIDK